MAGERSTAVLITESQSKGFKETTAEAKALDSAISAVTQTTKELNKAEISLNGEIDRLDRSLNPAVAALRAYEAVQAKVAKQVAQGGGNAEQQARVLEGAAARYQRAINQTGQAVNDNAKNYGLASHQIQNLSFQLNDLAVQVGSGQGLFRPLLQQGAQVIQILQMGEGGIRGSLMGLKDSLAKIGPAAISGFGVAVGAAVGLTTALVSGISAVNDYREQYNELQRVLKTGAGRQAGLQPGDVQGAAEAASKASRAAGGALSTGEARAVGIELAKTGKIGKQVMTDLIAETEAYAKTLGIDTPAAAKKLGVAFSDPAKGAEELAHELLTLSAAQVEQVGTLARMGDRASATAIMMQGLKDGVVNLKDEVLTATKVWEGFKAAALSDADRIAKAVGQAAMPKTAEQRIQDIKALPGTGLGGQVTPEDQKRRADAILKIQADASAKELDEVRKAEEAKRNAYSLTANAITQTVNSSIGKFKELQQQSTQLTEAMKHPELLADSAATAAVLDTVTRALGGATTAAEFYAVTLERAKQQGELTVAATQAQTQAALAQTEAERQAAAVGQARIAQKQAEFAAAQANQSQQQIDIAGQVAYNQVMAQADAAAALRLQTAQQAIAMGQQQAALQQAQTAVQLAQNIADRDAAVQTLALLTAAQTLNAEILKGTPILQAETLARQASNVVLQQEAAARAQAAQAADRQIAQGALELRSIQAVTVAERAQIAAEQSALATENSLLSIKQRLAQAEQARAQVVAQANATLQQSIATQQNEIYVLEKSISSIGMEKTARAELLAGLRAENELLAQGIDLRSAMAQAYIKNAQEIARLTAELAKEEAQVRANGDAYNFAKGAKDAFGRTLDTYRNSRQGPSGTLADSGQFGHPGAFGNSIAAANAQTFGSLEQMNDPPIVKGMGKVGQGATGTGIEISLERMLDLRTYGMDPKPVYEEGVASQALMAGKNFMEAAQLAQKGGEIFAEAMRAGDDINTATKKANDALNELANAGKNAAESLDLQQLGAPIQTKIDALRSQQDLALSRTYRPDPYAEKNPDFFYSGERIFKESQDKVYEGLQTQISKLEGLQTTLAQLVSQGEAFPFAIVSAMEAAGFGDIAKQIIAAFRSVPGAPASATPSPTAVQTPMFTPTSSSPTATSATGLNTKTWGVSLSVNR